MGRWVFKAGVGVGGSREADGAFGWYRLFLADIVVSYTVFFFLCWLWTRTEPGHGLF